MTDQHPEWSKENSLTSPEDRDRENRWRPEQGAPALTEPEVEEAMKSLNNTDFVKKFPAVDRTYQDPAIPLQVYGLVSFTPAKGATPNAHGIYGFAKLRGNYGTEVEANQRAEYLIRNADSYHQIYHTYVGRPFPITFSSKFSAETSEIDIRKQTTQAISANIKEQKDEEHKTMNEMKQREEKMLAESKKNREKENEDAPDTEEPFEKYITLCVKKAQLSWTFLEHLKKLDEVRNIILKTREELEDMNKEFPDFRDQYFEKYKKARQEAGLDDNVRDTQDNFIKYMVEDAKIPTIDTDEVLPKASSSGAGSSTD